MSLVGIFGPTPQPPGKSGGSASTDALRDLGRRPGDAPPTPPPASAGTTGTAPGEATQAAIRIPPPTPSRAANASTNPRPGGDGGDATARARDALTDAERRDAATASDAGEAQAKRDAEVAQERLIAQEILSRIPVPVEALPRLAVEAQRAVEEASDRPERSARNA